MMLQVALAFLIAVTNAAANQGITQTNLTGLFPALALSSSESGYISVCTLLTPKICLSAAHDLFPFTEQDLHEIKFAMVDGISDFDEEPKGRIEATGIVTHFAYTRPNSYLEGHDLAFVAGAKNLVSEDKVVKLNEHSAEPSKYERCLLVGYDTQSNPQLVQEEVRLLPKDKCAQQMPSVATSEAIFCVLTRHCYWLSGTALFCGAAKDADQHSFDLIGIASYNYVPCEGQEKPMVITKLASYYPWIQKILQYLL